jgi:hypothetical protein
VLIEDWPDGGKAIEANWVFAIKRNDRRDICAYSSADSGQIDSRDARFGCLPDGCRTVFLRSGLREEVYATAAGLGTPWIVFGGCGGTVKRTIGHAISSPRVL